jgi:hypothetical protein
MDSAKLLSLTLFGGGLVSLLVWLLMVMDGGRAPGLLRKSVVFFLLPGSLMVVIPLLIPPFAVGPATFFGILAAAVLIEEFLKVSAARSEARPADKFALICLFGIFELMLAKPLGPLIAGGLFGEWSRLGIVGFAAGGLLAMLMHTTTAALYAFRFTARPWLGLLSCFALHLIYNLLILFFLSVTVAVVLAVVLAIILLLACPDPPSTIASQPAG